MKPSPEPRLFPLLKHSSWLKGQSQLGKNAWSIPISRSLHAVLALRCAEFISSRAETVQSRFRVLVETEVADMADRVGAPMELALNNLRRRLARMPLDSSRDGALSFRKPFPLQASALLVTEWIDLATEHLGPSFIAAIPSQDRLLLFRDGPGWIQEARRRAREEFENATEPLSSGLFRFGEGRLTALREKTSLAV